MRIKRSQTQKNELAIQILPILVESKKNVKKSNCLNWVFGNCGSVFPFTASGDREMLAYQ
jgi:hypothetical protein